MLDTPDQPLDDPKARAARYRARAEEVRKRAASIRWAEVRSSLLETADTYDALAQTIEDIAERQAQADLSDRRTPEAARPFAEPVQQAVE